MKATAQAHANIALVKYSDGDAHSEGSDATKSDSGVEFASKRAIECHARQAPRDGRPDALAVT